MITASEKKALLFLSAVIALGSSARVIRARADPPSESSRAALALQLSRVDSVRTAGKSKKGRAKGGAKKTADALAGGPPIDLDTASAAELVRLPGIGPAVAARIVANRDTFGAFGSLQSLRRVRGIGPGVTERIRPYVTFSGVARPANAVLSPGRTLQERRRAPRATRVPGG